MPAELPSIDPISAGVNTALTLAQTVTGIVNKDKAKREAKELERSRPKYEISKLAGQELDQSESELANGGLSSTAENAYNNLNNKQFSASLGAILRGGGSVNNVADTFGANEEGRQRLALLSDQMRLGKIDRLSKARQQMMDEQDKEWQINDFAPWKDKQAANAQAREQAEAQIWNGLTGTANQLSSFTGAQADANAYNSQLQGRNLNPTTSGSVMQPQQRMSTQVGAPTMRGRQQQFPQVEPVTNWDWNNIPGWDNPQPWLNQ